jgi:hypothetical protein
MSLIAKRSIYLIDATGLTEFHGVGMKVQQTPTEGGGGARQGRSTFGCSSVE